MGRLGRPSVSDPWGVGSFLSPGRPTCVRCPGPPTSCSPVCPLGVLCWVCGVLGLPSPVLRCARSVCCVACAVSWASLLLFTGVPARCVVLRVRCPGPPGSCSPVCPLGVLCCVCGVLGLPAPVHRCARSVCCVACAVSWASRLLFTGAPARCVVLRVRCPGPPGSCSPVYPLGVLCWVCGVLGLPAPVHRCACSVCCVACAVSWASRLLFTGAPARCVVSGVRCPGPPGSCSIFFHAEFTVSLKRHRRCNESFKEGFNFCWAKIGVKMDSPLTKQSIFSQLTRASRNAASERTQTMRSIVQACHWFKRDLFPPLKFRFELAPSWRHSCIAITATAQGSHLDVHDGALLQMQRCETLALFSPKSSTSDAVMRNPKAATGAKETLAPA